MDLRSLKCAVRGRIVVLVIVALVAAACGAGQGDSSAGREGDTDQVMGAAVLELITESSGFGVGSSRSTIFFIQANFDPFAGTGTINPDMKIRALAEAERAAIEAAVEPFGSVRWIDDPADWRTEDLRPTIEGAVILGVGEPSFDSEGALVPVSLWCGGLCGRWLTYRLVETDQVWQVTGIEGPIAVS